MRKNILTIFGTRPEAIKLAPVIKELERHPDKFQSLVAVTAQHREMLDQVLQTFQIIPIFDLDLMEPGQNLFNLTSRVLLGLRRVLVEAKPDLVLVQGDTTTTFAAALAAFYLNIPVGHVEAGLRTFNNRQPFPEEMNRRLTTSLTDFHFAPTPAARDNLLNEGVPPERIHLTGNTVVDALQEALAIKPDLADHPSLAGLDPARQLLLITAHRRENWGGPIEEICRALIEIEKLHDDVDIVFSVHLNPEIKQAAKTLLANAGRIRLTDPFDYLTFVHLMNRSDLILTDSGGIQEEAPSLGKPVLVLRNVTERREGLGLGNIKMVGTATASIVAAVGEALNQSGSRAPVLADGGDKIANPYGDGRAARRIVGVLTDALIMN